MSRLLALVIALALACRDVSDDGVGEADVHRQSARQEEASDRELKADVGTTPPSPGESFAPHSERLEITDAIRPPQRLVGGPPDLSGCARLWPGPIAARLVISREGEVTEVQFLKLPKTACIAAAFRASFKDWRFEPATLDGQPVAVYYPVTAHVDRARR